MRMMRPQPHVACETCGAEFLSAALHVEHRRRLHPVRAEADRCGLCGLRLADANALDEHLSQEHGVDVAALVPCGECGLVFADAGALEEHIDQEHAQRAGMGPK